MIVSFASLGFSVNESVFLLNIIFDPLLRKAHFTAPANAVDPLVVNYWGTIINKIPKNVSK